MMSHIDLAYIRYKKAYIFVVCFFFIATVLEMNQWE